MRHIALMSFFLALFTSVLAQGVHFSPQSIIVNPLPSFSVEVFVDRDSSGNGQPSYAIGDSIRIGVRSSEDSYVYLYNVRSSGEIVQILPNGFDSGNTIRANQTRYFPDGNARYRFTVDGPSGLDKVIAVASKTPLNNMPLSQLQAQFRVQNLGEASFAQALSIVIEPLPQETWVSDTALFTVTGNSRPPPPPQPQTGTLSLGSQPSGADVYMDGQYVGRTPLRYQALTGHHEVRYVLAGYSSFRTSVNVGWGETRVVDHRFQSIAPQQVGVSFSSQPSGAEVYVDNRFVGITPAANVILSLGNHRVELIRSGYLPTQLSITVGTQYQNVHINLDQPVTDGHPLARYGLTPFPSSTISFVTTNDEDTRLEFHSGADVVTIFNHFDQGLSLQSYQRRHLDINSSAGRVAAQYRRYDQDLSLSLIRLGQGHYRLNLDLDF